MELATYSIRKFLLQENSEEAGQQCEDLKMWFYLEGGGFCSLVKIGLNVSPVNTTLHSRNEVYSLDLIGITLHFTTKVPTI